MEPLLILFVLAALAIPLVLPILSLISGYTTRRRVVRLEAALEEQQATIERLSALLLELKRTVRPTAAPEGAAQPVVTPPGAAPAPPVPAPSAPPPQAAPPPPVPVPKPAAPPVLRTPTVAPPAIPTPPVVPSPAPKMPPLTPQHITLKPPPAVTPSSAVPPPPMPPPVPHREPEAPSFDWESLVGVKLFSAIAGIALVLAALFFLRYSIEHGWLQPVVRVLIGIATGVALLVLCELKAARKYPVTANALDAAAIAILFSTFYAAHSLWDLISGVVTFGLLALVTAVAVILSIRRESLFIAVLGLLGGFATPALLSTGENRPIPLFAYLLLLNIGLAWVAYRQLWPILSVLTLVFTTIYQWGWVFKFLAETEPSLAMGVFLVFPVVTFAAFMIAGRARGGVAAVDATFERTTMLAAVLPLGFAVYFAAVPAYGARASLLFGFLMLLDLGLLAIAIARREYVLHAAGALATMLVMAIWLGNSYAADARFVALGYTVAFVALFLAAPAIAERFKRTLDDTGELTIYAAPTLLFVFPTLARLDPSFGREWFVLFGVLLALVVVCAWRALATGRGGLYYVASFFAVAAQAVWSTLYLTPDLLRAAVTIYGAFGLVSLGVPIVARRRGEPLEPAVAGGILLLASLGLLLFLSTGSVAPTALWALGILLAILNAALFIESAAGGLPLVSQAGSLFSWVILGTWWIRAAASVGLLPSLAFVTGLTLLTLGGHAWARADARGSVAGIKTGAGFSGGLYLGLIGHLFLFFVALDPEWSVPPWPLFGTLLVLTLATGATSLAVRQGSLYAGGVIAAAVIVTAWTLMQGRMPWPLVGLGASAAATVLALAWQPIARARHGGRVAAVAATAVLFISEVTAIAASAASQPPAAGILIAAHVVNLSLILALTWTNAWRSVAIGAAAIGWLAVLYWQADPNLRGEWRSLLALAAAIYAVFIAYPIIAGRQAAATRDPWLAAIVASAMAFFAGRDALEIGGYESIVGVVPVVEGLVMAVLLRMLLRIESAGNRDLGRLALVAGSALAFVTVAIPLQLQHQWITMGWALEGAALAWLYRRVPHRGLLLACVALLTTVFVRLTLNPAVFFYEPRGTLRIINWYLYAYALTAAAMFVAAWWLSRTDDSVLGGLRASRLLPAGAAILLFLLLNIEIADYYSTGPSITFRFGAAVSQDLSYTLAWLVFGMVMLAVGIYLHARAARVAAVTLIAVTTCKCFLYDLGSLGGLYRVGSLVGLAISLSLVALAIQKYVLAKPAEAA